MASGLPTTDLPPQATPATKEMGARKAGRLRSRSRRMRKQGAQGRMMVGNLFGLNALYANPHLCNDLPQKMNIPEHVALNNNYHT